MRQEKSTFDKNVCRVVRIDVTMMAASCSSVCSTTSTTTTATSNNGSSTSQERQEKNPESVILVSTTIDHHYHHHPITSMTIDIEEPVKGKPQRKDAIDEFHKKIIHEDTERGDFKISISNGNSHTIGGGIALQQPSLQPSISQSQNPAANNAASTSTKTKHIERPPVSCGLSGLPTTMKSAAAAAIAHEPRLIPR